MARWSENENLNDDSNPEWKLFPEHCWFERAQIVTIRDLETAYDCVSACGYIDKLAETGHDRVVVDLSEVNKIPAAFMGFMQSLCRRHAQKGRRIIIVGSGRENVERIEASGS